MLDRLEVICPMNPIRTSVLLSFTLGVAGCSQSPREVRGPALMANLVSNPLDCMVYCGADSTFYYFDRAQFKTVIRFKAKRDEIELPANVQVGQIPFGMELRGSTTRPAR